MKHHRKSVLFTVAISALVCIGYVRVSFSAPSHGVKYTKHNLSTTGVNWGVTFYSGGPTPETEICIFCHTPHNSAPGQTFLWNRTNAAVTWQMYTSSPTLDFTTKPSAPSAVSRMCLTCHDGAGALNAMANPKSGSKPTMTGGLTGDQIGDQWDGPDGFAGEWRANIGEAFIDPPGAGNPDPYTGGGVLLNDHPISFVYAQSRANDATINTEDGGAGGTAVGGLPLWWSDDGNPGYKVECVTCHDPHINYNDAAPGGNSAYKPFMRKSNASSSLCFTCHNK